MSKTFEELQKERKGRMTTIQGGPVHPSPVPDLTPSPSPQGRGEMADLTHSSSPQGRGEMADLTHSSSPTGPGEELVDLIEGFAMRTKITGVVVTIQAKPTALPAQLVAAIRDIDEGAEFDTEMRRDFGNRGDLKRAEMQTMSVLARGEKVNLDIIAVTSEKKQISVDAWLEPSKASEILGTLNLTDEQIQAVEVGLAGKEKGVLLFIGMGVEVSFYETNKDGVVKRRLAEFHSGEERKS